MDPIGIDMATAYNKYQFLGYEFLLWLWYLASKTPQLLKEIDTEHPVDITFGDSVTVETTGSRFPEKLTIKGIDAGFEEAFIALAKGGSIVQANMVIAIGGPDQEFQFTLNGENLTVNKLKCNVDSERPAKEDVEGGVMEKQFVMGVFFSVLDNLYLDFIDRRIGAAWGTYWAGIRQWIVDQSKTLT